MRQITNFIMLILLLGFGSCSKSDGDDLSSDSKSLTDYAASGEKGDASTPSSSGNNNQGQSGIVTAGEWNDLENWKFWGNLLNEKDFSKMPSYWGIYTNNRLSFFVHNDNNPVINARVELVRNKSVVWTAKTDNRGYAELWIGMFQKEAATDLSKFILKIDGKKYDHKLSLIKDGVNDINLNNQSGNSNRVEISFIVDATGSMGDELEFLKADLKNVIDSVKIYGSNLNVYISTVFYRDEGDDYIVRKSDFTDDLGATISFINKQSAEGGGDFPEAVHTALNVGINELQWSEKSKTRIAFLLLDAPPHYDKKIIENLHNTLKSAAKKGIKIIPITASGIDKETEFLMRFMSISTNGTYVFITDDSGVGNSHLKPSVGKYNVEHLNSLIIRLIKKYSK